MRSSSANRGAVGPAGSNMNDAGYPFRGTYKLDKRLNHGHGGATREKSTPTSLMMKITGSNLVISQLTVPSTSSLACELGVGNERAKLIHVPVDRALEVPHDRREYNLTTIITGTGGSKHYNKLVLQSDGNTGRAGSSSPLRHRTPTKNAASLPLFVVISSNLGDLPPGIANPNQPRSGAYFICGNDIVKPNPSDGSFTIPTDVSPCHLVVTDPEVLPMPSPPSATGPHDAFSHAPQFITLECDPVDDSEASPTSPLNGPVVLDADGREYRCFSDRRSIVTLPTPKPGTAITLRVPKPRPTPPPPPEPLKLPEIATDISPVIDPVTGATNQTAFTVAAAGFHITLTVAGYEPMIGFGQASISVSSLLAHKVHIALSNPSTKERVLSQNSTIPRLNGENSLRGGLPQPSVSTTPLGDPIILKVGEQIDGMLGVGPNVKRRTVVTAVGGQGVEIAADGRPAGLMLGMGAGAAIGGVTFLQPTTAAAQPPAAGAEGGAQQALTLVQHSVLLDTTSSHFVDVTNKATGASCRVHFDAKVGGVEEPQWVWDLARELDDPNSALNNGNTANNNNRALNPSSQGLGVGRNRPDESLTSAISAINPQTPNGSRIISYLISRLTAPTPKFSFELKKDQSGISNIVCDGFGLSYAKGSERLCHIQQGEQANFSTAVGSSAAAGPPLRLVASDKNSGTRKAEVVIVGGGAGGTTAANAISGDGNPDVNFLDALNRALDPHCRYPDVDPRTGNLLHNEIAKIPAVAGIVAPLVKPKLMQLAKEWPGGSGAGTNMAFLLRLIAELNKCVGKPMTSEAMRAHMNNVAASMIGVGGGGGLRGGPLDTERLLLDTISELFGPPTVTTADPNATIPLKLRVHRDGPVAFSNLIADGLSLPLPHNASSSSAPSIFDIEIPKTSRLVNISCGAATLQPTPPSDGDNLRRFLNRVVDAYNKNNSPNMRSAGVNDGDNDDKECQKRANLRRDWDGIPTTSPNGGGSDVDAPAKRILLRLLDDLDDAASRRPNNNNNRNGGNCNQPVISYRVNESGAAIDNVMFGLDGVLGAATTGVELWADCDGIPAPFRVAQSSSVPPQEMQQQLRVAPKLIKLSIREISTGKIISEVSTNLTGSGIGGNSNNSTLSSTRPNLETTISGSGEATIVRVAVLHPYKVTCRLAEEAFAIGNPNPHQFIQGGGLSALDLVYGGAGILGDAASPQGALPSSSSPSSVIPSQTCVRRFDCSKSHNLVITIYDGSRGGAIIGEDRLTVPRLGASTLTLDYRDGILSYRPLPSAVITAKFNGSTERAVTHPAIPLDVDLPHQVTISQYDIQTSGAGVGVGGGSTGGGARGAETSLAIPVFISKEDIERIVSVYNNYGPISPSSIAPALGELKKSAKNRVTRDLLDALIKNQNSGGGSGNGSPSFLSNDQGSATRRIHTSQGGGGHTTTITTLGGGGNAEDKMVFFRLRGEEERRRNVSSLAHVAATGGKASSNVTEPYASGERAAGRGVPVGGSHPYGVGYNSGPGANVGRYV